MKLKSLLQKGLLFLGLIIPIFVFASNTTKDLFQTQEQNFNFNWNNYLTIEPNKAKINDVEAFIKNVPQYSSLNEEDKHDLALVLYRLGTYYTHIMHEPDLAIAKLELADSLFTIKREKALNYNHLAYAYEQKYSVSGKPADKEKALQYVDK